MVHTHYTDEQAAGDSQTNTKLRSTNIYLPELWSDKLAEDHLV